MIKVDKLNYKKSDIDLFTNVTFEIEEDIHYALIGSNGAGKSTLVDMILNSTEYLYKGKFEFDENLKNSRIGYVSQFDNCDGSEDVTVFEYISREFVALQEKIAALCEKMSTETDLDAVFEEYQKALDENEAVDGDNYDTNIKKQLKIAGLEKLENQKLTTLSGGEFKLVQIIRELMLSPKLVFMDEPDAFLDFERINALKELINAHKGTLVVITQNRFLLNHCFDGIIHLENCDVQTFKCSYEEYKAKLLSNKIDVYEALAEDEEEIKRQTEIVNQMRYMATTMFNATLGRRVHARQTIVDRLTARKTKIPYIEVCKPELVFESRNAAEDVNMTVPGSNSESGSKPETENVLEVKNYDVAFDEVLLENVSFEIKEGEKVAIIGKNGTGKTTLLKDIFENSKDTIRFSANVQMQMFSQSIRNVDEDDMTAEEILLRRGIDREEDMDAFLEYFGFSKYVKHKRLRDFSGGERDFFKIALMTLKKSDFLIFDEPTGHLDIFAQSVFEEAVRKYNGSVLMVSHDFYSVVNCVDYVLFVEDGSIRKMSIRKFRQMIYDKYFDKEYLIREDKLKNLEMQIDALISKKEFEAARKMLENLSN